MWQVGMLLPHADKWTDMMRQLIISATDVQMHLSRTGKCTSLAALKRMFHFSV
jgi:hypothetical protein